jgi:mercuric ion binding protein
MVASAAQAAERTVTLSVEGMTCASCPYIVRQSLASVDGVLAVDVSFDDKTAVVTFDDSKAGAADLTQATAEMGFPSQVAPPAQ